MTANIFNWSEFVPHDQWRVYRAGLAALETKGLSYAIGGGYAFSAFSHRWRDTKDLDIYILPEDHEVVIAALEATGFCDYFDQAPYDRSWSFRAFRDGIIVDALWGMPNHRAWSEESWLTTGPTLPVRGMTLKLLPVEELVRLKLYVFHRLRCDWPDVLNLIYAQGPWIDWQHLLTQLGDDRPLLGSVMELFAWMCPRRAQELPARIWDDMGLSAPSAKCSGMSDRRRAAILASEDWFGPKIPERGEQPSN